MSWIRVNIQKCGLGLENARYRKKTHKEEREIIIITLRWDIYIYYKDVELLKIK